MRIAEKIANYLKLDGCLVAEKHLIYANWQLIALKYAHC